MTETPNEKKPPTPFQIVCFFVLLNHHGKGIIEAHPDYIKEKLWMLELQNGNDALSALDAENQSKVREWCYKWGYPIPPIEYD